MPFYPSSLKTKKIRIAWDIALHMYIKNHKHMSYCSWDMEWDRIFVSFWAIFCPFTPPPPPNNLENQNFEKMEVVSGDGIISHMCTKNYNHMMYASWDMDVICHFGSFFALLHHYWPQKLKPGKNIKKPWRYYPFTHKWKVNEDHRCMVCEIKDRSDRVLLFWVTFLPSWQPKKSKFWKNKTNTSRYHFTLVYHKWQLWCMVPEIWSATDRIFCHFELFFTILLP